VAEKEFPTRKFTREIGIGVGKYNTRVNWRERREQRPLMTPSQRTNLSVLVFAAGLFLGKFFELRRQAQFSTDMGDAEIARVMAQSSILHVGGQHRGGTTLTWDGLQQHPDVSSFSTVSRELDEDFDEDEGTGVDALEKELHRRRLNLYPHITQFRSEGV